MFLTEQEFLNNLPSYMVRKCDFIEFVMKQWQAFTVDFANKIESHYVIYDSFSNQDGLNQSQFV